MRIRFTPRHRGGTALELRDIIGSADYGVWRSGEEKDVPASATVQFREFRTNHQITLDAATAIFRHGPHFVDAATGKNPLYTCKACGEDALEEHFTNYATLESVRLVDASGNRLCQACFLGANPKWLDRRRADKVPDETLSKARTLAQKASAPPSPAPSPEGSK